MTSRSITNFIYDASGARIGCTIALANGKWAAWSMKAKIGEFATVAAAERAVSQPKPAPKSKSWELR